jgi:hypothetical protein
MKRPRLLIEEWLPAAALSGEWQDRIYDTDSSRPLIAFANSLCRSIMKSQKFSGFQSSESSGTK